jgi:predicted DsbA family dithiol-disulfide isomerase
MGAPWTIDVWSDVVCPWCFLGKRRLELALRERPGIPATVRWQPFELNPDLPVGGADRAEYLARKFGDLRRLQSTHDRLVTLGAQVGITYRFDRIQRVPNTRAAHALIALAGERQNAVVESLFQAYFELGHDVGDVEVLAGIGRMAGVGAADLGAQLGAREMIAAIEAAEDRAAQLGVGGVPFFVLAGRWALSGAQEPATLVAALDRTAAAVDPAGLPVAGGGTR